MWNRLHHILHRTGLTLMGLLWAMLLAACGAGDSDAPPVHRAALAAASPAAGLSVTALTKVGESRVSRTVFEYTFKVRLSNMDDRGRLDITAMVRSAGPGTTLVKGSVHAAAIAAHGSVVADDTIVIRHDRSVPFAVSGWTWVIDATVGDAATGKPTPSAPVITLPGLMDADFSGQPQLHGMPVTLAARIDETLNATAENVQDALEVAFTDTSLQLSVPAAPDGAVPVRLHAAAMPGRLENNQAIVLYVHSFVDPVDGDGQNDVTPLLTTIDPATGAASAMIPAHYFRRLPDGSAQAVVRTGLATSHNIDTVAHGAPAPDDAGNGSMPRARSGGSTPTQPALPCPLPALGCIETSRFNPARVLSSGPRPHLGIDLRAKEPSGIVLPAGGTPGNAYTPAMHQAQVAAILARLPAGSACPVDDCAAINQYAGITLTVNYIGYKIRLMHLSAIAPGLLNQDGTLNRSARTSQGIAVAYTGRTGLAYKTGAHLHYELYRLSQLACTGLRCSMVYTRVDPFPHMVHTLKIAEASGKTTLQTNDTYGFQVAAFDADGVAVRSDVGNAAERGQRRYDPTRKICLGAAPATLDFISPVGAPTWPGLPVSAGGKPSVCYQWGTTAAATANSALPATEVNVRYSTDPQAAIEPLSDLSASWRLNPREIVIVEVRQPSRIGTSVGVYGPATAAHACSFMTQVVAGWAFPLKEDELIPELAADVAASGKPWSAFATNNFASTTALASIGWHHTRPADSNLGCECDLTSTYPQPNYLLEIYQCTLTRWFTKHKWDSVARTLYIDQALGLASNLTTVNSYYGVYRYAGQLRPATCYPGIGSAGTLCVPAYNRYDIDVVETTKKLGLSP